MKAKIYVVLEDYDNGESYEENYRSYRAFIDVAGTIENARRIVQDRILDIFYDPYQADGNMIVKQVGDMDNVTIEQPIYDGGNVSITRFYIEEKEVTIPD